MRSPLRLRARLRSLWRHSIGHVAEAEWTALQSYLGSIALWTVKFWSFLFVGVSWCVGLACAAVVTYLLLYQLVMPQHHTAIPVHFDFAPAEGHPLAVVHLHGSDRQWRYSSQVLSRDDSLREEHTRTRYFSPGHTYDAFLDLAFPDSAVNQASGMVNVEMVASSGGTPLATSLQAFLPQYTSPLVKWMWSWVWALPLVTGLMQEKQHVSLHMFDQLLEQEALPISDFQIKLKLGRQSQFHLYSATLRLQVQLSGIRYFMYHWPLTTGAIITGIIFSCQLFWSAVLLLALCLLCCGGGKSDESADSDDRYQYEGALAGAEAGRQPYRYREEVSSAEGAASSSIAEGSSRPRYTGARAGRAAADSALRRHAGSAFAPRTSPSQAAAFAPPVSYAAEGVPGPAVDSDVSPSQASSVSASSGWSAETGGAAPESGEADLLQDVDASVDTRPLPFDFEEQDEDLRTEPVEVEQPAEDESSAPPDASAPALRQRVPR